MILSHIENKKGQLNSRLTWGELAGRRSAGSRKSRRQQARGKKKGAAGKMAALLCLLLLLSLSGSYCSHSPSEKEVILPPDEIRDIPRHETGGEIDNGPDDSSDDNSDDNLDDNLDDNSDDNLDDNSDDSSDDNSDDNSDDSSQDPSGGNSEGEEEDTNIFLDFLDRFLGLEREPPAEGPFAFQTLLETEILVQLNLFDLRASEEYNLAALTPQERSSFQSNEPGDGILTLQRIGAKEPALTAAIGTDGRYEGSIILAAHSDGRWQMELHKKGYQSRRVEIESLLRYARIDRTIQMAATGQTDQQSDQQGEADLRDSDGDNIPNIYDAFPNDPRRAFVSTLPQEDYLTVAYEDNWPNVQDADYNDFVARYQVTEIRNNENQVVELAGAVEPVAMKSLFDHKFGIYIRFPGARATLLIENSNHEGEIVERRESEVSDAADILLYKRTEEAISFVLPDGQGGTYAHRYKYYYIDEPQYEGAELRGHSAYFHLRFHTPLAPQSLDRGPYDPYLITGDSDYDIHLAGKEPLPGTKNPASTHSAGFRTADNYPWALLVPANWLPPKEREHIENAYSDFKLWRESRGTQKSDWYLRPEGGRVEPVGFTVMEEPDFPEIGPTDGSHFAGMDWNIRFLVPVGDCRAPKLVRGAVRLVADGEGWQDFLYCHLRSDPYPFASELGLNHSSFTEAAEAVHYVAHIHERFSLSEAALELTALQKLERLYEALTFHALSSADRTKLNNALQELSYDEVLFSLLSAWFHSAAFQRNFDYDNNPYVGSSWIRIRGKVQDHAGRDISGAPVRLRVADQAGVLSQSFNSSRYDRYVMTTELANDLFSREVILRLESPSYVHRDWIVPLQAGQVDYSHDFQTVRRGRADPQQGGEVRSANGSISAIIPPGAVTRQQSFTITNPSIYTLQEADPEQDQEEQQALHFTITPDHDFNQPVQLQARLSTTQKESLGLVEGDEDLALYVEEQGELRMLIPSIYDPESGMLTAPTMHFSSFVIASCGAALCRVGGSSHLPPSNRASLLMEPRQLRFPRDLSTFQGKLEDDLKVYGWQDTAELVEDFDSSQFCRGGDCSNMVLNLKDGTSNIPLFEGLDLSQSFDLGDVLQEAIGGDIGRFFGRIFDGILNLGGYSVRGGEVLLTSSVAKLHADLITQTEQCAVNPLYSPPQLRLNQIPAIRASISSRFHVNALNATWRELRYCEISIRFPSGIKCKGLKCKASWKTRRKSVFCGTRKRSMHIPAADVDFDIDDMRFSYAPGNSNCSRPTSPSGSSWCLSQQSLGRTTVNITGGSHEHRSRYQQIREQLMAKARGEVIEQIRDELLTHIQENFALSTQFDDTNCLPAAQNYAVNVDVSGLESGEILRLQNNGINEMTIDRNGSFPFSLKLADGANYAVSVKDISFPVQNRYCLIEREQGFIHASDATVTLSCTYQKIFGETDSLHTCAIVDGAAWCWGINSSGQLGDGTQINRIEPVQVTGLTSDVTAISVGVSHTCAIQNGAAKCWGSNSNGQLGDGTQTRRTKPVEVSGLTSDVTAISGGIYNTCAIQDKGAKCWGDNEYGQLGDGTQTDRPRPVEVSGLTGGVTAISTGRDHTCAIQNGGAKCWGRNRHGQLGNGTRNFRDSRTRPVKVSGLASGVNAISAGVFHTCAIIVENKAAKCWGLNTQGQVGNGVLSVYHPTPVLVSNLQSGVVDIGAGYPHSCSIVNENNEDSVKCWSRHRRIAPGRYELIHPFVYEIAGLAAPITDISVNINNRPSVCAVANNQLFCWGNNQAGQLGLGYRSNEEISGPTDPVVFPRRSGVGGQSGSRRIILSD